MGLTVSFSPFDIDWKTDGMSVAEKGPAWADWWQANSQTTVLNHKAILFVLAYTPNSLNKSTDDDFIYRGVWHLGGPYVLMSSDCFIQ